ncbi:hypothetical protein FDK38_004678 [Candidozyma auris]|nr:hypothetical protein FDK38_004678 [[Candida] auris]
MSALPSSKKTHSEKNKQILKSLLKEPANKTCADCKTATHPRWASWNLGCFVCIRCSGIHRSMGTHISRVKSVDLDAWTDEQVESMLKWGNSKCNAYWESKLPDGYVPDASKIENFIRTKYDMRKWAASSKPDPSAIPAKSVASSAPAPVQKHTRSTPAIQKPQPEVAVDLLNDDFGTFSSASPSPAPVPPAKPQPKVPPQASVPPRTSVSQPAPPPPQKPQQHANNGRNDLKKSILSLYSSPSSSNSNVSTSSLMNSSQPNLALLNSKRNPVSPAPTQEPANSLSDSLHGLSFGPASSSSLPQAKPPSQPTNSSPSWENQWNDSSASINQWASDSVLPKTTIAQTASSRFSSTLDDDLFKNVWS